MQMHVIPIKELLRLSVQVRSAIHQCQCDQLKNQWNCHQLWHPCNCNSFSSNANSIVCAIGATILSSAFKHMHHTKNVSSVITGYAIVWVCNQCKYSLSCRWSTCNQMTINAHTSRWPPNATVNRLCTHLAISTHTKCLWNHQSQCTQVCVDATVVQALLINWFMQSKRIQNACAITKYTQFNLCNEQRKNQLCS